MFVGKEVGISSYFLCLFVGGGHVFPARVQDHPTSKAVSAASLLHARRVSKKVAIARRAEEKGTVQQLLGMKGAGETDDTPLWKSLGPNSDAF